VGLLCQWRPLAFSRVVSLAHGCPRWLGALDSRHITRYRKRMRWTGRPREWSSVTEAPAQRPGGGGDADEMSK
jgi:hypothetical protein